MKKKCIDSCVDEFLQDQLIIFMALAKGTSKIRTGKLELHTETSIHFSQLLTGAKFKVTPDLAKTFIIECEGIGFINKYKGKDTTTVITTPITSSESIPIKSESIGITLPSTINNNTDINMEKSESEKNNALQLLQEYDDKDEDQNV